MFLLPRSKQVGRAASLTLALGLALASVLTMAFIIKPPETNKQFQLTSTAFKNNQPIPGLYTCDGKNISPPLAWVGEPVGTKSFVLIVDDPDAPSGVWTHWVLFDLPGENSELAEAVTRGPMAGGAAKQGLNDFKQVGYGGPCPPGGKQHRYYFKLYALDSTLDLKPGASRKDVEAAMAKHVLAQGQLMGTYQRK